MIIKTLRLLLVSAFAFSMTAFLSAEPPRKNMEEHRHKRFEMIDTNKDGKVNKAEWEAHFKAMDANNDGNLTEEEMEHHRSMMQNSNQNQKMDGSGKMNR